MREGKQIMVNDFKVKRPRAVRIRYSRCALTLGKSELIIRPLAIERVNHCDVGRKERSLRTRCGVSWIKQIGVAVECAARMTKSATDCRSEHWAGVVQVAMLSGWKEGTVALM